METKLLAVIRENNVTRVEGARPSHTPLHQLPNEGAIVIWELE